MMFVHYAPVVYPSSGGMPVALAPYPIIGPPSRGPPPGLRRSPPLLISLHEVAAPVPPPYQPPGVTLPPARVTTSYTPTLRSPAIVSQKEKEEEDNKRLAALHAPWAFLKVTIAPPNSQPSLREEMTKPLVFTPVYIRANWNVSADEQKKIVEQTLKDNQCDVYLGGASCHTPSEWSNPFAFLDDENITKYIQKILGDPLLFTKLPDLINKKVGVIIESWHHMVLSYLIRHLYTWQSQGGKTEIVQEISWNYLTQTSGMTTTVRTSNGKVLNVLTDQLTPFFRD